MTRDKARKEYLAIRRRARTERVTESREAFDACMEERGAVSPPPVPPEWLNANRDQPYYAYPVPAWQLAFGEWWRNINFCREREQNREFDTTVAQFLAKNGITKPTPVQWVEAAEVAPFLCRRCGGTGQFVTYVENGIPKGPGGICFRCDGKGYQTDQDARRNYYHDTHWCPPGI